LPKKYLKIGGNAMKKIFKLWLANELVNRGLKVVKYEVNTDNPKLKVFVFEDTKELSVALKEAMSTKR
jgi:hypothetical protein